MAPHCSIVLVKMISVASGCASTLGGMVKGMMSATLLSPKVYGTGDTLGFCIFPLSLGCSLNSCESVYCWALPSQTLQALALLDGDQLFGLRVMTVPFPAGMWSRCSLGPWLLLSLAFLGRD